MLIFSSLINVFWQKWSLLLSFKLKRTPVLFFLLKPLQYSITNYAQKVRMWKTIMMFCIPTLQTPGLSDQDSGWDSCGTAWEQPRCTRTVPLCNFLPGWRISGAVRLPQHSVHLAATMGEKTKWKCSCQNELGKHFFSQGADTPSHPNTILSHPLSCCRTIWTHSYSVRKQPQWTKLVFIFNPLPNSMVFPLSRHHGT